MTHRSAVRVLGLVFCQIVSAPAAANEQTADAYDELIDDAVREWKLGNFLEARSACAALLLAAAQLQASAPPGRYTIDPRGLVTDERTKLVWERTPAPGTFTVEEAKKHCANSTLASAGWRLPATNHGPRTTCSVCAA